jgi:hypothetical protein
VVVAVAEFFLRQTPVERPAEAAAQESEYLRVEELLQAGQARLPRPVAVEAEGPRPALRAAAKLQPQSDGSLKQHRPLSRNTIAAAADKLAVSVALAFVSPFLAYSDQLGGPGTPLSASLLISNEIL